MSAANAESAQQNWSGIAEPLDVMRLCLGDTVFVKCKKGRSLRGVLHAYDPHLNLVLSKASEVIQEEEIDKTTGTLVTREKANRKTELLFVRGDGIILVTPDH